jgi:hypothetical protein
MDAVHCRPPTTRRPVYTCPDGRIARMEECVDSLFASQKMGWATTES